MGWSWGWEGGEAVRNGAGERKERNGKLGGEEIRDGRGGRGGDRYDRKGMKALKGGKVRVEKNRATEGKRISVELRS